MFQGTHPVRKRRPRFGVDVPGPPSHLGEVVIVEVGEQVELAEPFHIHAHGDSIRHDRLAPRPRSPTRLWLEVRRAMLRVDEGPDLERQLDPAAVATAAGGARPARSRRGVPPGDEGPDEDFPFDLMQDAGYHAASSGSRLQRGRRSGTKAPPRSRAGGMPDDPADTSMFGSACARRPHGRERLRRERQDVGDPAYVTKLAWFDALRTWVLDRLDLTKPLLLAGDFNITPDDRES